MKLLDLFSHRKWQRDFKKELEDELNMVFIKKEELEMAKYEHATITDDIAQTQDQIERAMSLIQN